MEDMDIFEMFTRVVHKRDLGAAIHHASTNLTELEEKYPNDRAQAILLRWMQQCTYWVAKRNCGKLRLVA